MSWSGRMWGGEEGGQGDELHGVMSIVSKLSLLLLLLLRLLLLPIIIIITTTTNPDTLTFFIILVLSGIYRLN